MTRFDTTTIRFSDLAETMRVSELEDVVAEINDILGELKDKPPARLARLIIDFNKATMVNSRLMGKIAEASQSRGIREVALLSVQENILYVAKRYGFTGENSKIRIVPMYRTADLAVFE
ncbi:MAG: hypothetical protein L7F77_08690 [Candidatus Magnetominusculus sp. LBB02]|nr:hypothetical protein [Candidatus Magnetominusculus sp. LBB02]